MVRVRILIVSGNGVLGMELQLSDASLVALIEAPDFKPIDQADLESKLGELVDPPQPVLTNIGQGMRFRIPRRGITVGVLPDRWEIAVNPVADSRDDRSKAGRMMGDVLHTLWPQAIAPELKALGYNYTGLADVTGETAVSRIGRAFLRSGSEGKGVASELGLPVLGASVALFLEYKPNVVLWLRFEPRGNDRKARHIWVSANFTWENSPPLPSPLEIQAEFLASLDFVETKLRVL